MALTWSCAGSTLPAPSIRSTVSLPVTGRLIGSCIETMCSFAGTPHADVDRFATEHAPEGLIVHVEASDDDAGTIRNLHGMRPARLFTAATEGGHIRPYLPVVNGAVGRLRFTDG